MLFLPTMTDAIIRNVETNDWLTILLVLALVLTTVAKSLFESRFAYFTSLFTNNKYISIYGKEKNLVINRFSLLLFSAQIISLAIFIYLSFFALSDVAATTDYLFIKIISYLLVIIAFKYFLEKTIAAVFEIDALFEDYNFQKISYRNLISLYLIPINALLIYFSFSNNTLLYITIALFILVNLAAQLIIFRKYQKLIIDNLFYFILYLCALEIAPYLVVLKVIHLNAN
ncbi:DUF4271 domain-containing protein [Spongiivirga citrea]|uniref:DUF4271 domain-containing protein n=1 Tax=Spongiivirga citrea TaxID=1481457 RepID=A0A6M0CT05_9FLAO|nr:DUF4271 domain-containing protein [Spongiivirga citrea]NER16960.1 DUF4271 domain-containing protein [Spongiivirga citrea]